MRTLKARNKPTTHLLTHVKSKLISLCCSCGNALIAAAYDSNKELVQILLNNKTDPNKLDQTWGSALQVAASYGDLEIFQLLLDYGASVNTEAIGNYGSVLQAACFSGNKALVELRDQFQRRRIRLRNHGSSRGRV